MKKEPNYYDMLEEIVVTTNDKRKKELRIKLDKARKERRRIMCF